PRTTLAGVKEEAGPTSRRWQERKGRKRRVIPRFFERFRSGESVEAPDRLSFSERGWSSFVCAASFQTGGNPLPKSPRLPYRFSCEEERPWPRKGKTPQRIAGSFLSR